MEEGEYAAINQEFQEMAASMANMVAANERKQADAPAGVRIVYGGKLRQEFDDAIRHFMESRGFYFCGMAYSFDNYERELSFKLDE